MRFLFVLLVKYIYSGIVMLYQSLEVQMGNEKIIYIADDEPNICNIIKSFLIKEGFQAHSFSDGLSLLEKFKDVPADLVILDIMMPGVDGFAMCSEIRKISNIPIIIVSAKDTEADRIQGLTLGSDDYLTKPFSPMELIARIKSIFRRIDMDKSPSVFTGEYQLEDLKINHNLKQAQIDGKSIGLTGMEFAFLCYLADHKNMAISRGELLDKIWGFESEVETRATDDMIKRIRKKLADAGSILKIETVWGFGFKIEIPEK